jgi:hypothetical protein
MKLVAGLLLILPGSYVVVQGTRLLWTGENMFPGWMSRPLRMPFSIRLDRAPATYFRAYGVMAISGGVLIALLGVVFMTPDQTPDFVRHLLSAAFLISIGALFASWITIGYLVSKYHLREWDQL